MANILSQNNTTHFTQNVSQKQKLSSHQLHSIRLLESSANDLEQILQDLVNSNPLLALTSASDPVQIQDDPFADEKMPDDATEDFPVEDDRFLPLENETASSFSDFPAENPNGDKEWDEHLEELAYSPENWGDGSLDPSPEKDLASISSSSNASSDRKEYFFDSLTKEQNIKELLMEELAFSDAEENIRRAAECIIGSLEDNGYFTDALTDVAQTADTTLKEAEAALELVQSFDPAGVGASSLSECLLLQLRRWEKPDLLLEKIVKEHLEDVAKNRLPFLADKLKIRMEKLSEKLEKLKKLDPAPAGRYNQKTPPVITPDVIVQATSDGEFLTFLNDKSMPKLYFTHEYDSVMDSPELSQEDKNYFREKTVEGKLAIYELEHRASTILRIARLIVSEQYEFFKHGKGSLKPFTMHQAADKLGLDDSTISRSCNQKYMLTPRGLFEFKYFFNTGFVNQSGEEVSNKAVMEMIRTMIEKEDPAKPLSDDTLSKLLKEKGYSVARRTVMKYREKMCIASSQGRRKHI